MAEADYSDEMTAADIKVRWGGYRDAQWQIAQQNRRRRRQRSPPTTPGAHRPLTTTTTTTTTNRPTTHAGCAAGLPLRHRARPVCAQRGARWDQRAHHAAGGQEPNALADRGERHTQCVCLCGGCSLCVLTSLSGMP